MRDKLHGSFEDWLFLEFCIHIWAQYTTESKFGLERRIRFWKLDLEASKSCLNLNLLEHMR